MFDGDIKLCFTHTNSPGMMIIQCEWYSTCHSQTCFLTSHFFNGLGPEFLYISKMVSHWVNGARFYGIEFMSSSHHTDTEREREVYIYII